MAQPIPFLNPNQFEQQNVVGQLARGAQRESGVINARISPNATGPLVAGTSVKFDTTAPSQEIWVLPCAASDVSIGSLVFTERASSPVVGEFCEVAVNWGPILWKIASVAITVGQLVEDGTDGPEYAEPLGTTAGAKQRGIAVCSAAAGALVMIATIPSLT